MDMLVGAWLIIIGFCVFMYVLLDGMDLGVGILFGLFRKQSDRDLMISSILPVWDGNQTWLVLGGASLYGAFPLAFSLLLPSLYLPLIIMVLGLLFRGICFEFRLKAKKRQHLWDHLFFVSSTLVCFLQGMILGTCVKGFAWNESKTLLQFNFFTPFNITCGLALIFGYSLLGSSWIIGKTSHALQAAMYPFARMSLLLVAVFLCVFSVWTPLMDAHIRDIWFNPNYFYKLACLPLLTGLIILYFFYSIYKKKEYNLFWLTIGIFICGYAGVGISTYPYLIPRVMTIWEAASSPSSQLFMLFATLLLLPVLLGYTLYAYYIFRGKVTEPLSY